MTKGQRETALAWCAGLIDGEGCIGISRQKNGPHRLQVRVVLTDKAGVLKLREIIGAGSVYQINPKPPRRTQWVWCCGSSGVARSVLKSLRPHLVIVAKEADIALRFLEGLEDPERLRLELRTFKRHPGRWREESA